MKMKLIETSYKAEKVLLSNSGVEVTGNVYVRGGEIYKTDTISCTKEINGKIKNFSFTLKQQNEARVEPTTEWNEPVLNVDLWPAGLSVNDTVEEYKRFVLNDIA